MKKTLSIIITISLLTFNTVFASINSNTNGWVQNGNVVNYYKDGNMIINSFIEDGICTFYLDSKGIRTTGIANINNNTYIFNRAGIMLKGWYEDNNNNWYYLNQDGTMAQNTTIDGYIIGTDGSWIK